METPAAIRPANAVARMFPVYRMAIRVAISLRGVEDAEHVDRSGVVCSLRKTEEETDEDQASIVVYDSCEVTDDGRSHHSCTHIATGTSSVEERIGRGLA